MKSHAEVDKFEKTSTQLEILNNEISILSKKKPDNAINKFKLQIVNNILKNANELLGEQYKPFSEFTLFDEDVIPTNSDVVMILAQYIRCMGTLRSNNLIYDEDDDKYYWLIKGRNSKLEA